MVPVRRTAFLSRSQLPYDRVHGAGDEGGVGEARAAMAVERPAAAEFAARKGWNASTLQWWGSTLRRELKPARMFIDVTPLMATPSAVCIEIVVRDAVRVRVSAGFDAALLRAIVAALETR